MDIILAVSMADLIAVLVSIFDLSLALLFGTVKVKFSGHADWAEVKIMIVFHLLRQQAFLREWQVKISHN